MYRNEHHNPQFMRRSFECLNGLWDFQKGKYENLNPSALTGRIEVPFCPESKLSGLGDTDFITDCVYARDFEVREEDFKGRLFLHFGAVDYHAVIYINGERAGEHTGGYTAFKVDITKFVKVGSNRVAVAVHDDVRENIPSGKQSKKLQSYGCFYTRTTGIWQTVWLERTPVNYVKSVKFYTAPDFKSVTAEIVTEGCGKLIAEAYFGGKLVGSAESSAEYRCLLEIPLTETHLWEIGKGNLYDVVIKFGDDEVRSYFGLRTAEYEGKKFLLNGKSVFQRLVLDQGYYEDGIYTAKDVKQFSDDIALSLSLGFNGARLHQKVFEQRFLYECDKVGYIVWGEFPNWGMKFDCLDSLGVFVAQWSEVVEQYFNHPSIITWCPLNEVWEDLDNEKLVRDVRFVEAAYHVTKTLDSTRPCVDTSGGYHGKYTDVFDFHNYHMSEKTLGFVNDIAQKDVLSMDKTYAPLAERESTVYNGELPLNASEYGGMSFPVEDSDGWGYHAAASEDDFIKEYLTNTSLYLSCEKISGFCYTQLYDVEQEQNGIYSYSRQRKFSDGVLKKIAECNAQVAAIEQNS